MAESNGVNWKSGKYVRSLAFDAVFLYWPSAFVESKTTLPYKKFRVKAKFDFMTTKEHEIFVIHFWIFWVF